MHKQLIIFCLVFLNSLSLLGQVEINNAFFEKCNDFFAKNVSDNGLVNYDEIKAAPAELLEIIKIVDKAEISALATSDKKAFHINAYNLNVIKGVVFNYPLKSVMDVPGFFDNKKHWIAQKQMTLNDLENKVIRPTYNDARTHFALVCGALGCPPIINEAYTPENVEALLERQTKRAINNPDFIKVKNGIVEVSKIFEWYAEDFGKGKKGLFDFLNKYAQKPIDTKSKLSYYSYDWTLNKGTNKNKNALLSSNKVSRFDNIKELSPEELLGNDISILPAPDERYYVSALYNRGQFEVNIFNNFYTEKTKNPLDEGDKFINRGTFFTTYINALFGINNRFNIGFDSKIRSVVNNAETASKPLEAFGFANSDKNNDNYSRFQPTAIGPRVKYTPFKKFGNISIQQTLYFPLGKNLEGSDTKGFADWQGLSLWNQLFYDTTIGDKFGLFAEIDLFFENFTSAFSDSYYWQFSTPMTIIPSYFPTPKIIIYALIGSAPQWALNKGGANSEVQKLYVPYNQYGLGFKYQFSKNWLGEILYTEFSNSTEKSARTFNLGIRYIKR